LRLAQRTRRWIVAARTGRGVARSAVCRSTSSTGIAVSLGWCLRGERGSMRGLGRGSSANEHEWPRV
jgi:hypothetical protein